MIVTIADRPDLVPTVANWLWNAFSRHDGYTFDEIRALVAASTFRVGAPQCFVALVDETPVGTASLALEDLAERPTLTPWLAGVFVIPEARRRGHAWRLVATVEAACVASGIKTAWLHTNTAEALYTRAGWRRTELVPREGKPAVSLMRKDFVIADQ